IWFHHAHYRTFKAYYTEHVQVHLRSEFPTLVSYQRFVELMPRVLLPLTAYLHTQLGACSGISFIDSTPLAVCRTARIRGHRVWDQETVLLSHGRAHRALFPHQPERSRFNRRRRDLAQVINLVRQAVLEVLDLAQDAHCIIDSLPVPVVQFYYVPQ